MDKNDNQSETTQLIERRQRLLAELATMRNEMMPVTLEKRKLEVSIAECNDQLRRRLPPNEFIAARNRQVSCKKRIVYLEERNQAAKKALRLKQAELEATEAAIAIIPGEHGRRLALYENLRHIRNRWQSYADLREERDEAKRIAVEFAQELRILLSEIPR